MVKKLYKEKNSTYKIILMDFEMSEIDGMEITACIRKFLEQEAPDIAHPYICCLTKYREYLYKE